MATSLINKLPQHSIDSIVRRYQEGDSSVKLAEHYGVVPATIIRLLRERSVKIKGRGRYPQ